jgi:aconitate hydratase
MSKNNNKNNYIYGFDIEMIKVYDNMTSRVDKAREIVGHHLLYRENFIQSPLGWYAI